MKPKRGRPAITGTGIEEFMNGLRYETRLYPDLWAPRLAAHLRGESDPGALRTTERGDLVYASDGRPFIERARRSRRIRPHRAERFRYRN